MLLARRSARCIVHKGFVWLVLAQNALNGWYAGWELAQTCQETGSVRDASQGICMQYVCPSA